MCVFDQLTDLFLVAPSLYSVSGMCSRSRRLGLETVLRHIKVSVLSRIDRRMSRAQGPFQSQNFGYMHMSVNALKVLETRMIDSIEIATSRQRIKPISQYFKTLILNVELTSNKH